MENKQENQQQQKFSFKKVKDGPKISILSYNILAEFYCKPDWFQYADPKILNFKFRSQKVIEQLKDLNSDIICLQEVDNYIKYYKYQLETLGYKPLFMPKSFQYKLTQTNNNQKKEINKIQILESFQDDKFLDNTEGILIAFKKDLFNLIEVDDLIFSENLPDYISQKDKPYYYKDHRALFCKLQHKKSNLEFLVANTHTHWDPKADHVKYYQVCKLFEYISQQFNSQQALIICGDINQLPNSNALKMIIEQEPPIQERVEFNKFVNLKDCKLMFDNMICKKTGKYSLKQKYKGCYQDYRGKNKFPKFTTLTQGFQGTIDHIFYNTNCKKLKLDEVLDLPIEEEINKYGKFCPNKNHPSDHLPIMAIFNVDF